MKRKIQNGINSLINILREEQSPDGSWRHPFETGIATDCYMIILLRTLKYDDEKLIKELTERIVSKQERNGAWKLFYDEKVGNITTTLEAYYALLYSGYYEKKDARMKMAKKFILEKGGIEKTHMFSRFMLAITGQYKWPTTFPIPIEVILLPTSFPVNFYHFSVFGRANIAPIMVLAEKKFSIKNETSPDLSDLLIQREGENEEAFLRDFDEWRSLSTYLTKSIQHIMGFPGRLHSLATEQIKQYMLRRIEADGTFLGYFSSTFLMIFALLALGYSTRDPIIKNAIEGLKSKKCKINGFSHIQYTTSTVWNTSLISYALQESGLSPQDPMLQSANQYLLMHQHFKYGDWVLHNQTALPGGWGFAHMNTIHPDIDDTTASLRSIARFVQREPAQQQGWVRGIHWLLTMQNDDGGWPAFEKNTHRHWLKLLPIEKGDFILTDPSSADLTGRTLEFLGAFTNLSKHHPSIRKAVKWLAKNQERDGSWYGRWGICYIYGTWAAITGLRAVGALPENKAVQKGVDWLTNIQNEDGGWGESCYSDLKNRYIPLKSSTLTHTAWAVDALLAASDQPSSAIKRGITYLLEHLDKEDWTTQYPKGQGMAGGFYIHYHSYRYIFPLLTLAHFNNKYSI